jgi:triacylglycerol lipase
LWLTCASSADGGTTERTATGKDGWDVSAADGNMTPALPGSVDVLRSVGGAALECAWWATHVTTYPLGLLRERRAAAGVPLSLSSLSPARRALLARDVETAGMPVLLVHGVVDNRTVFARLRRELRRRGFTRVESFTYSPLLTDIRDAARALSRRVDDACAASGSETVQVVGHSLGGLVARYYVQRLGGDRRVETLVSLGTPHGGTRTAQLVPHPIARQLRPGSALLQELAAPAPGCSTRFVAVWSDLDQMVMPRRSAVLEHSDLRTHARLVRGVGHLSLPVDGRVIHEVVRALGAAGEEHGLGVSA